MCEDCCPSEVIEDCELNKNCKTYEKAKDFINILARIANFTTKGTHGAFMFFSSPAAMYNRKGILKLDQNKILIEFSDQLETINFTELVNETIQGIIEKTYVYDNKTVSLCKIGGTQIINALNDSLTKMFNNSKGMREDAEKVAVLITDGIDTDSKGHDINKKHVEYNMTSQKYLEMAENFKQRKIKILAIGVGAVNDEFLKTLVQSPEHFITVKTFDNLVDNLTELIGSIICKGM